MALSTFPTVLLSQADEAADSDDAILPETDDKTLMLRSGRGDHAAFSELVQRHERWARSRAWRMLGDEHEAEDIAQEAFLRTWRAAPQWKPQAQVRSYLKVILDNLCLDYLRRKRPVLVEEIGEQSDPAPDPLQVASGLQAAERMARLIEGLTPAQRTAILLVYGDGLRPVDAAKKLRMRHRAFDSLLHRARVTLREAWKENET